MSRTPRKVVFMTGCASGIGRHLSKRFLDDGHRVFCTDIDREAMTRWISRDDVPAGQVAVRKLDVRQPTEWKRAIGEATKTFGDIDLMMNIAGYLRPGYLCDVTAADVDRHIDINVKGVMFGTQAAAEVMVDQQSGHIINIGSLASLSAVPGLSLYGGSKFAVRGFSLAAAEELRGRGVDVSVVLLDAVKTPMLDKQASCEEAALTFSGRRPLELEDVEELIVDDVIPRRPLEVTLPKSRGLVARMAGLMPDIARLVEPFLRRRGRRAQQEYEVND